MFLVLTLDSVLKKDELFMCFGREFNIDEELVPVEQFSEIIK